jgi:hypothetical protein
MPRGENELSTCGKVLETVRNQGGTDILPACEWFIWGGYSGHEKRSKSAANSSAVDLRSWSKRYRRSHCSPAAWLAVELERPVQLVHALSHIDQPQPSGFSAWLETDTIIGHRKTNVTVGPTQPNVNLSGFRMFGNIAECFLGDAV